LSKFRKKPVVIEAMVWDGSIKSTREIVTFMGQDIGTDEMSKKKFEEFCNICCKGFSISTLEGDMKASIGDYIIKGIKGEFYPCKPDIFEASYEIVE